jgi:GntR family transcriptional regulator, transcriptional repressor for pyruvate dehydrogenase complex
MLIMHSHCLSSGSGVALTLSSRPPKTAMLLARRIVRDAVRDRLGPGDTLPTEREMADSYETGRATLRESLRLLEFQGVIEVRPGTGGGPVLLKPDASHLASTMILLMQLTEAPFRTVVEVRNALEPMISSLAADRISPQALSALATTINDMRDTVGDERLFLQANKQFHDIIAQSCGNALFGYLIESLLDIMDGAAVGINYPQQRRPAILRAHEKIYDALAAGDAEASEQLMRAHILEYERYAKQKFPDVLNVVIQWDRS